MALQAPAIVDVRPTGATPTLAMTTWLRGIGVRQVRLACGLVMFTYIFSHFFNHALGNISYAAMETWLTYTSGFGEFRSLISRSMPRQRRMPGSVCGRSISVGTFATRPPKLLSSHWV